MTNNEKYEWRKIEKHVYLPKAKPELINIPEFRFLTISGKGNPNSELFSEYISVLYAVSYTIKMTLKKLKKPPRGYCDYTVYPLEGLWDINEAAKKSFTGKISKDDFVYKLMIRQPDFVNDAFFKEMLELTKIKKPHKLLKDVKFETITEGKCIQMMHIGSFDDEPESFKIMEDFSKKQNHKRRSQSHKEIYLSDIRRVAPEKLKTVLRFNVE